MTNISVFRWNISLVTTLWWVWHHDDLLRGWERVSVSERFSAAISKVKGLRSLVHPSIRARRSHRFYSCCLFQETEYKEGSNPVCKTIGYYEQCHDVLTQDCRDVPQEECQEVLERQCQVEVRPGASPGVWRCQHPAVWGRACGEVWRRDQGGVRAPDQAAVYPGAEREEWCQVPNKVCEQTQCTMSTNYW